MLEYEPRSLRHFEDISRFFYGSFAFSIVSNSITTLLTFAYVVFGWGSELNPVMSLELGALGLWVLPFHVVAIVAYYLLFYLTMKRTSMAGARFTLWYVVLVLIPILSVFDLLFDFRSML